MRTQIALKEWAAVVDALGRGEQLLLLRKGGIRDAEGAFHLEHREFLLYPTGEHQREKWIRPPFRAGLKPQQPPEKEVVFRVYAGVAYAGPLKEIAALSGLEKYHIWTPEFFAERNRYRPASPSLVLVLRAYRLKKPHHLPVEPEYAGCRSWVTLKDPFSVEGAEPVLDNRRFRSALEEIRSCLEG